MLVQCKTMLTSCVRSRPPLAHRRVAAMLILGVGVLLIGTGVLHAQSATPPDATELTLLDLERDTEAADVVRILGRPRSVRTFAHPNDRHGRYDLLQFRHVLVLMGPDGLKLGVTLIAPGPSTRRGLSVGDPVERALARYGPPDERTETQLRWRIASPHPRDHPRLVVEVRDGKVASIFAGYVIEGLRPLPDKPRN